MTLALALLSLAAALGVAAELLIGNRAVRALASIGPRPPEQAPRVTVVVAARDEQRKIAPALRSVLSLDYPDLEIVAVDDRSRDATGVILDHFAEADARLRVVHVSELPAGWLGKNHALHAGAAAATGELLLFTDADIVFEPSALSRAVAYLESHRLDHLAVTPDLTMPGTLLGMFGAMFAAFFGLFARPWKVREPGTRWHIGIGAFNLVRAEAYRAIGGHRPIALRPDDDMKLGKLVKQHGYRQDVLIGRRMVHVEWYSSLGELVRGLRKNVFAGVDYRLWVVLGGAAAQILVNLGPIAGAILATGTAQTLFLAAVLLLLLAYAVNARVHGAPAWYALGYPLVTLLFVYILLASTALTLARGGIEWRGTFYRLDELRRNRV